MVSRFGYMCRIFGAGMVLGVLGLQFVPAHDGKEWARFATAPISNPPTPPCEEQAWPNADRACLAWTATRAQSNRSDEVEVPGLQQGQTSVVAVGDNGERISRSGAEPSSDVETGTPANRTAVSTFSGRKAKGNPTGKLLPRGTANPS